MGSTTKYVPARVGRRLENRGEGSWASTFMTFARAAKKCWICSAARAPTWPKWLTWAFPSHPVSRLPPKPAGRSSPPAQLLLGLHQEISEHLARLERDMGKKLGDPEDPLLVSVRSGAKFSMPGMMDTVLDIGLNDSSVEGLAKQSG